MSRGNPFTVEAGGFQTQRNRLSLLLSQIRRQLVSGEYQDLLKMQWLSDRQLRGGRIPHHLRLMWLEEVQSELDTLYETIERGDFNRSCLRRLKHLYGHLL
ncbi:MAG: hypothetical protein ACRD1R_10605 [Acidobacteriota bacterium]